MNRQEFRRNLQRTRQEPFVMTNLPIIPSRTDPSFALSGKQIFVAAMQGLPLPEPPMLQFNNVKADHITALDRMHMDRFERLQLAQRQLQEMENTITKQHSQYQQTKNEKDEK